MLSVMPVFHGFGLGIGIPHPLVAGAACILVPQFTIDSYARLVRRKKPSFIPGVPTLFEALLRAEGLKDADLSFLRGVFSGGDTLTVELKRKVDAFLSAHHSPVQIREGYGTTECVTASCLTPIDQHRGGQHRHPLPRHLLLHHRPRHGPAAAPRDRGRDLPAGPPRSCWAIWTPRRRPARSSAATPTASSGSIPAT